MLTQDSDGCYQAHSSKHRRQVFVPVSAGDPTPVCFPNDVDENVPLLVD